MNKNNLTEFKQIKESFDIIDFYFPQNLKFHFRKKEFLVG
jgi:hypothetical protein